MWSFPRTPHDFRIDRARRLQRGIFPISRIPVKNPGHGALTRRAQVRPTRCIKGRVSGPRRGRFETGDDDMIRSNDETSAPRSGFAALQRTTPRIACC